jgi:membrane protease YdiL (CAAX protease family)
MGLIAVLVVMMIQQTRALRTQAAMRTRVRPQVEPLAWFLPRTPVELRRFTSLSVTAGICEELLCRGWFLALLAPWLPPVVTLIVTSVFFGLGHWYQGKTGMVKTGVTGLIMGTVYLLTGSLLVPMVLHAVVDIGGGYAAFIVLNDTPTPEPASPDVTPAPMGPGTP